MSILKDARAYLERLANIFVKYKYVMLVAAVGLFLMAWPFGREEEKNEAEPVAGAQALETDVTALEEKLVSLLKQAEGVGRVEVMLSLASDMEYVYASEQSRSLDESSADGGASSPTSIPPSHEADSSRTPSSGRSPSRGWSAGAGS